MKKYSKKRTSMVSLLTALALALTNGAGLFGEGSLVKAETSVQAREILSDAENREGEVSFQIAQEYAVVGEPLTVNFTNAPEGIEYSYEWRVNGTLKASGETYTPSKQDLEKMLTVAAKGKDGSSYEASMYISKLPVIYVDTEGNQEIVSKEDYINADLKIQGNTQYNSGNTTLYDGLVEIRGRGNSTWGNPKKPYKLKLDSKTDVFGFGKNKHWVLLANYTDESHMRNMLSYNLSGSMGMPYMQSVPVDLIINGSYRGTYQFCEHIRVAEDRVNIHDWEDYAGDVAKAIYKVESENGLTKDERDDIEKYLAEKDMNWMTTGKFTYKNKEYDIKRYISDMPNANGGFLLELDEYHDEVSKFRTSKDQPLQFSKPEFIATNKTVMEYVQNYVNTFEQAIDAPDFSVVYDGKTTSYSQLFDMDSLVQFWLVNELFMNVDAMKKSTYLYKDVDGLFHMGPIWDMDWSSGSLVSQYEGSGVYDTWQTIKFSANAQGKQWYKSIIKDPYFAVKAYEWYTKMRKEMGDMTKTDGVMDTFQELISESAIANENMWYSDNRNKAFATQVQQLKTYLNNRLNWMDKQFATPENLASSLGYRTAGGLTVEQKDISVKDSGEAVITVSVTDSSVKDVEFMVNGVNIGTAKVAEGKAAIEVSADVLEEPEVYNTVQVFGLNADGNVIVTKGNKVTDFEKFYVEKQEKPIDPDPDNPDPPTDPDNPDPPTDPDNPDQPTDPDNPDPPTDPDNPDPPTDPDNPDQPTDPDNPDPPTDPDVPDQPTDPSDPSDPTEPTVPEVPKVGTVLTHTGSNTKYRITKAGAKNGKVEYLKNKNDKATFIQIPASVKINEITYQVTGIADKAFKANKKITKVKIGNNVTKIGKQAFSGCIKLKNVVMGRNVTSIGEQAFYKCKVLPQISIPNKVTKIGKMAFYGCKKMSKASIGTGVKSIGAKAFSKCSKLKNIVIKTSKLKAKNVGSQAFQGVSGKAVVKTPAKNLKAYKKLLKKRGISGKQQKCVGLKTKSVK